MYKIGFYIDTPIGNNEFSYQERIALGSNGKIFIPELKQGTVADLEEGSEIVFEEASEGKLISCTGLKYFIQTTYKDIPTYIFDNHNHALSFRHQHTTQLKNTYLLDKGGGPRSGGGFGETKKDLQERNKPFIVLHIDQHADIKENKNKKEKYESIEEFVHTKTNVGNFITAAIHNNIIDEVVQIRSEHALHNMEPLDFQNYNYILDIDVDFWEGKTDKEIESDFAIIRKLVDNTCLITIATSPYFFNQKKAIEIIKKGLEHK